VIVHHAPALTNQQSVAADFEEILGVLESRLGRLSLVLAGLCSGADNAMTLALNEPRVVGMVLLDPIYAELHRLMETIKTWAGDPREST